MYITNFIFDKDFIIKLNELKILSIISCKNIKLSEISNEKLKELCLCGDESSNVNYSDKDYINILKKLEDIKISDINILEKVNFKNLKILDLNHNQISDINILEKVDFK